MKKLSTILLISFLAVFLAAGSAMAIPTLSLNDGTSTITVQDGGANDLSTIAGVVLYTGPIGTWSVNVVTGLTKPEAGNDYFPSMDLNSINYGVGELTISFSETDFMLNPVGLTSAIGGTTVGTVLANAYLDATNTIFGESTNVGTLGPFSTSNGTIAFSDIDSWSGGETTVPYSLTLKVGITHLTEGNTSFDFAVTPVPEPATMILLGTGLMGLAGIGRKKFFMKG